jgi:hypothetical protein
MVETGTSAGFSSHPPGGEPVGPVVEHGARSGANGLGGAVVGADDPPNPQGGTPLGVARLVSGNRDADDG